MKPRSNPSDWMRELERRVCTSHIFFAVIVCVALTASLVQRALAQLLRMRSQFDFRVGSNCLLLGTFTGIFLTANVATEPCQKSKGVRSKFSVCHSKEKTFE